MQLHTIRRYPCLLGSKQDEIHLFFVMWSTISAESRSADSRSRIIPAFPPAAEKATYGLCKNICLSTSLSNTQARNFQFYILKEPQQVARHSRKAISARQ